MKKFTVTEDTRLSAFTDDTCAQASFCLRTLLKNRDVRVNGVRVCTDVPLRRGDEVCYYLTPAQEARRGFSVLYEDENVIVADKESGVNAAAVFSALAQEGQTFFIHRLDRNTCGVMAFARNDGAERALSAAFKERRAVKIYEAVCFHPFKKPADVLTAYLVKDAAAARVRVYAEPCKGAEKIVTEYFGAENAGELARVHVRLHSGKTHQIRAHLAFIGHPVAGDEKYGDEALNKKYALKRHILVAKELSFFFTGMLSYLNGKLFTSSFSAQFPKNEK